MIKRQDLKVLIIYDHMRVHHTQLGKNIREEKEMIKLIVFSVLLNAGEMHALPPDDTKIEARRRGGKRDKGRRKGGNGLR